MNKIILHLLLLSISIFSMTDDIYSIEEYIDYLIFDHSTPQVLNSKRSVSKSSFILHKGVSDWGIQSSVFSNHIEPFQTSGFVSSGIDRIGTSIELKKPILFSGGSVSFCILNEKVTQAEVLFNGLSLNEPIYYENKLFVAFQQPLLYGLLGESLNYPILVASNNVQQIAFSTSEEFEVFLLNELTDYIDWALSYEVTELSFARLQLARESLNQTKERVRVNLSEKIDLLRAEFSVQKAHQLWLTQKASLKSVQFKFSSKLNNQGILSKTPKFALYETVYVKKPSYIIVEHLRSVKQLDLGTTPLTKQLELSQSKRNGFLTLSSKYDFLAGSSSFGDNFKFRNNNFSVSLNYSRPLTDTQSIETVNINKQKLTQHNLSRNQLIIDLESEIISLYTLIEEYKKILNTTLNQIIIAQEKASAEEKLYNQGRSSLDMVIQSQDNVLDSKLNYANLSASYQKLILTYQALIDELLTSYKVSLNDVKTTDNSVNIL